MKVYKYKYSYFLIAQFIPSILMLGVFIWSLYMRLNNPEILLFRFLVVVMPVVLISTFISLNQPNKIVIDDDKISFYSFGMRHFYDLAKIKKISVKEFALSDKYFVRVGEPSVFRGRYWISKSIIDNEELLNYFKEKEKIYGSKDKPLIQQKANRKRQK